MNARIVPLNLPAGLDREIPGNPVTTRLESAIGNCYPGLEVDAKNLDRRFFPGLVFEFVGIGKDDPNVMSRGAQLVKVESQDPDTPADPEFKKTLRFLSTTIARQSVFLVAFTVDGGDRIELVDQNHLPFDWDVTWRLIRSLPARKVTIELSTRREGDSTVSLTAPRRTFQNPAGELSTVYQPGEMSQSLCSPWQHDFRDCGCMYWASNHPDIVLAAHPADFGEVREPGDASERAEEPSIWMRFDQSHNVAARPTRESCSPFEMDHYEINDRWRDLPVVLGGREHPAPWSIGPVDQAPPLDIRELEAELRRLATVEHALALEYLYARYSVCFEDEKLDGEDRQRADFIAHELLLIALSEMLHLRWVNQLLGELFAGPDYRPALGVAKEIPEEVHPVGNKKPTEIKSCEPAMRRLDEGIDHFIASESASGGVDGQYAKIRALLQQGVPADGSPRGRREFSPEHAGLVERIISDGVTHYSRFREIKALLVLSGPGILRKLRDLEKKDDPVTVTRADGGPMKVGYSDFVLLYRKLITNLRDAYSSWRAEDRDYIIQARLAMTEVDRLATQLAREGWAVPFLKIAREVTEQD